MEKLEPLCRLRDRLKDLDKRCEDGVISPEEFDIEARKAHEECQKEQQKETQKCSPNLLLWRPE